MTELTRAQVERLAEHLRFENLSGVAGQLLAHDAALRARLEGVERELDLSQELLRKSCEALRAQLATAQARVRELIEANEHWHVRVVQLHAERAALTSRLTQVEADLETQRTATYQAVEREHAAKKRLTQVEAALKWPREVDKSSGWTYAFAFLEELQEKSRDGDDCASLEVIDNLLKAITTAAEKANPLTNGWGG